MRTFLSQLDTARCSDAGLKHMSDMLSSGGLVMATSLLRSPWVGFALAADAAEPKIPAMVVARGVVVSGLCAVVLDER